MSRFRWLSVTAWMVRDTFRQSLASGIGWLLLGLSGLCIAVCLSISVTGPQSLAAAPDENPDFLPRFDHDAHDAHKLEQSGVIVADGSLSIAFGLIRVPVARDVRGAVHFLELLLAGGVADTLGLLLALIWTAGFLPSFLDGRSVSVLLAKPAPRWWLLSGKYIGVLCFVLLQSIVFVGGTWLAIGVRTGVWDFSYLLCVPLLLLHFAIFFSFSLLLAVCTRSTVTCVFGSIAFWGICWAMNYGRHMLVGQAMLPDSEFAGSMVWLAEAGYWILPKPADLGMLVYEALDAKSYFAPLLSEPGIMSFWLSVVTSLAFTGYLLVASAKQFATTDY